MYCALQKKKKKSGMICVVVDVGKCQGLIIQSKLDTTATVCGQHLR